MSGAPDTAESRRFRQIAQPPNINEADILVAFQHGNAENLSFDLYRGRNRDPRHGRAQAQTGAGENVRATPNTVRCPSRFSKPLSRK